MPLERKPTRYAHPEGHTDVCYFTGEKGGLITCGSDGDVRYWLNLMDDDPTDRCIAEQSIAAISKNDKIYVGNDNNTVQILSYPDLEKEGIVTRFSAAVTALATHSSSNLIVAGSADMKIKVTDIVTNDVKELSGHEGAIFGLSLDPKEEFLASSSGDGTLRIWNIAERQCCRVITNSVTKNNSFFTASCYGTPSFQPSNGKYLAYPCGRELVILERTTWKELRRLQCPELKSNLSICKYSECGKRLAASSSHGEVVVWDADCSSFSGYIEGEQNTKVTCFAWSLTRPNEIAYCDSSGQLGCIDVPSDDSQSETAQENGASNVAYGLSDDDDDDNVISLDKIKASVDLDDKKSVSGASDKSIRQTKPSMPQFELQEAFQPGATPNHLLSRFMVWNDVGIVRCYTSEDASESNIEVEFHDMNLHHAIHINNYLHHKVAALSSKVLALCCNASADTPSQLVAISLQGWGSGNKEWSVNLPEGEEAVCVAAGDNFIAVSTTKRNLRLFTCSGTQREVLFLPGPVVTMNACKNQLVLAYHAGVGAFGDQVMKLLWIRVSGINLKSQTMQLPLSPSSELMWLGLSDLGSPILQDEEGIISVYDRKSSLWRVVSDANRTAKGKADHYFVIGVSEIEALMRCVLCKGSQYPQTTPRPTVVEIPLVVPLCDHESDRSIKEATLWQCGTNPHEQQETLLSLIALACRNNVEYRAVELCEELAPLKVVELAIKYAGRINRMALANRLESIAEQKDKDREAEEANASGNLENGHENGSYMGTNDALNEVYEEEDDITFTPESTPKNDVEIRPLFISPVVGPRRSNPFLKSTSGTAKVNSPGLAQFNTLPENPRKAAASVTSAEKPKANEKKESNKEGSFVSWYGKNKKKLQEEFPELSPSELTKAALKKFKDMEGQPNSTDNNSQSKKRKLSSEDSAGDTQPKHTTATKLSCFAFSK